MVLFFTVVLVQPESVTPSHPAIAKIINTNLFQEKLLLTFNEWLLCARHCVKFFCAPSCLILAMAL